MPSPLSPTRVEVPTHESEEEASAPDEGRLASDLLALREAQFRIEARLGEIHLGQQDIGSSVAELRRELRVVGSAPGAITRHSRLARLSSSSATPAMARPPLGPPPVAPGGHPGAPPGRPAHSVPGGEGGHGDALALVDLSASARSPRNSVAFGDERCDQARRSVFASTSAAAGVPRQRRSLVSALIQDDGGCRIGEAQVDQQQSQQDRHSFVAASLPLKWPQVLRMREDMQASAASRGHRSSDGNTRRMAMTMRSSISDTTENDFSNMRESRFVIDPNSKFHIIWGFARLTVLLFDLSALPFMLAWDLDYSGALYVFAWLIPSFWTLDIGLNLVTGFYKGGEIQKEPRVIVASYCKTWLIPDLAIVVCDWISIILAKALPPDAGVQSGSDNISTMKFTKLGRLLRLMGLARMFHAVRMLEVSEFYVSEGYRVAFKMVTLFGMILWFAHLIACGWFVVGKVGSSDTGAHWIDNAVVQVDGSLLPLLEMDEYYQYMVAFHWAAAQIALGAVDTMPTNSMERWVFVIVMMCGFLFGSTLVSTLSAAMMDYQMMQKDKTMKLRTLRQYLRDNDVDTHTAVPVQKQAEQRLAEREALHEEDVMALQLLSATLRSQLRFEIQRPHLTRHPIFRLWLNIDAKLMHRACMKGISFVVLRPKDDLFGPGVLAHSAYAITSGDVSYTQQPDSSPVTEQMQEVVQAGEWLSEAAMWVEWITVGKVEAVSACRLLEINAAVLLSTLQHDMLIQSIGIDYCRQFHKRVTAAFPPQSPYPTDLSVPFTDYCDLVVAMSAPVRVAIGQDAVGQLSRRTAAKALHKLEKEVEASKSVVVVLGTGAIARVVSLVVLRLVNQEGHIFTQVGKKEGKELKGTCQLPGVKQDADELVSETYDRMFRTKLPFLEGKVEYISTSREVVEKESKEYGVQTRYARSICAARLRPDEVLSGTRAEMAGSQMHREASMARWPSIEFDQVDSQLSIVKLSSSRAGSSKERLLRRLQGLEVYALSDASGAQHLFTWLPASWFEALSSNSADKLLQLWISSLVVQTTPPPAPAEPPAGVESDAAGL